MSIFCLILNPSYTKIEKAKHWPVEFEPPLTDIRHAKSKKRFDIKVEARSVKGNVRCLRIHFH